MLVHFFKLHEYPKCASKLRPFLSEDNLQQCITGQDRVGQLFSLLNDPHQSSGFLSYYTNDLPKGVLHLRNFIVTRKACKDKVYQRLLKWSRSFAERSGSVKKIQIQVRYPSSAYNFLKRESFNSIPENPLNNTWILMTSPIECNNTSQEKVKKKQLQQETEGISGKPMKSPKAQKSAVIKKQENALLSIQNHDGNGGNSQKKADRKRPLREISALQKGNEFVFRKKDKQLRGTVNVRLRNLRLQESKKACH